MKPGAGMATRPGTPRLLRELNDRAALELLISEGPLTRARIGERTGLSKVTASQLLARLEDRGLVEVVGEQAGGRGPNAALYAVVPGSAFGESGEGYVRCCFATGMDKLKEAMNRIEKFVEEIR